mmetsp:Transcript_68264/g.113480  ORF Transcript_68264/g.113480 Transcript_68264/m.113480 type:complete len:205 (-) Transcript_68264:3228-3842(-)
MSETSTKLMGTAYSPCSSYTFCLSSASSDSLISAPFFKMIHAIGTIPSVESSMGTTRTSTTSSHERIVLSISMTESSLPPPWIISCCRPSTEIEPSGHTCALSPRCRANAGVPSSVMKFEKYAAVNASKSPRQSSEPNRAESPHMVRAMEGHGWVHTSMPRSEPSVAALWKLRPFLRLSVFGWGTHTVAPAQGSGNMRASDLSD